MSAAAPTESNSTLARRIGFWLGLLLFAVLLLLPPPVSMRAAARAHYAAELPTDTTAILSAEGHAVVAADSPVYQAAERRAVDARARVMMGAAAVAALTACWWITVAIPIPATSLLPLLLFPIVGVLPIKQAASPYADPSVFLFMGGFIIALGIERWGLHRRIALHIVRTVGTSQSTIVLGFMIASAVLSMWISNTATAMMMLPIGLAVVAALPGLAGPPEDDSPRRDNFAPALMLGIAYAASIGGVATPIGTPPNISFRGQFARLYPDAPEISFGQWLLLFVPLVCVFLPIIWLVLTRVTCRVTRQSSSAGRDVVTEHLRRLGPPSGPEVLMAVIFTLTGVLWMTRSIPLTNELNVGWSAQLERLLAHADGAPSRFHAGFVNDATVALAVAIALFAIPARRSREGRREYLMDWETAQRLPWGILLLFGGGFSIAAGLQGSGLSLWCGQAFAALGITNPLLLIIGTCLLITFLTEITSNTATTQVMLPIVASVAGMLEFNPLLLMLPATLSASCAFMLPVATPPNAIVFGSGQVEIGRMVRTGILLNLIGVALVAATVYLLARPILGIDAGTVPEWAH